MIDRNINYTNSCTDYCSFCAFYRPMGHAEGYMPSVPFWLDQLVATRVELDKQDVRTCASVETPTLGKRSESASRAERI